MRLRSGCVTPWMGIARAALLMAAPWLALASGPARADIIVTNEGTATNPIVSSIARYKDNGTLLWSTPASVYANSSGITAEWATSSAISADGSTVYSTVWTKDTTSGASAGGEIMVLNAATGAVTNIISLAGKGFDQAYSIATAADGTFWLGTESYSSGAATSSVVHLNSDFSVRQTSASFQGAERGIALDGAGNPIVSCCRSATSQLFKYSAADLSAAPANTPISNVQSARGIKWYNGALYMTLNTPDYSPIVASGSCNYRDDVLKFTEDSNGALVTQGSIITLLTPCSNSNTGAAFTDVTQDVDGNFWVSEYWNSAMAKYSPSGQLLATVSGLTNPDGVEYIYAPEPASMAVLGVGVAGLIGLRRRAKR